MITIDRPETSATHTAVETPASTPAAPRVDLYAFIHKALRALMFDTLQRLGRLDADDAGDTSRTLDQAEALLAQLRSHVDKENAFVHTAIEARRPGGAATTADAHVEHLDTIAALYDEIGVLREARAAQRPALAERLYRHLALFVADNLEHMHYEETANNAALWSLYTDAELLQIQDRLVAAIDPAVMMGALDWMAASLRPQELAMLLGDIQTKVPPEGMRDLLAMVRGRLDDRRWAHLAHALGLPGAAASR